MEGVVANSLELIPVECLQVSRTNPRRQFDADKMAELSSSIEQVGVQQPLLVRPLVTNRFADGVDTYEIVAGERRYRAVKALGHETVPCLVREMTDAEAREIQIVENLQRADVHPLEEAQAFDHLVKTLGSIPAAALRVGKVQSYVAKLLRLMALTLPSRDAMRAGLITSEHALLLARLAEAEQNAALKWTLDHNAGSKTKIEAVVEQRIATRKQEEDDRKKDASFMRYTWEPQSVVRLKAWIEAESGILLSRAPWPLDQYNLLPDVVCCNDCPQNTKANAPLFGDLEMGEATCTNGACFEAKRDAFVRITLRTTENVGGPEHSVPVRLSWKSTTVKPPIVANEDPVRGNGLETANPAKVLKYGQWLDVKAGSCTNFRTGVTVDWSDAGDRGYMGGTKKLRMPGEVLAVCIAVGCKAHPKAWEKDVAKARQQQERHDPEAQKRAEEEAKHVMKVETEIRVTLLHAILGKLDASRAVHLVADKIHGAAEWRKRLLTTMPEMDGHTLEAFTVFCSQFSSFIQPNRWQLMQTSGVASDRKGIFALAKSVGIDGAKVTAKYFHDQGSIAPASDRLYPKGVPWPKDTKAKVPPAKKAAVKKAAGKKTAPIPKLKPEARKRIAEAMKRRLAATRKGVKTGAA